MLLRLEEKSYQEIADIMGIAIGTIMSRLSRARGYIRDCFPELQKLIE